MGNINYSSLKTTSFTKFMGTTSFTKFSYTKVPNSWEI